MKVAIFTDTYLPTMDGVVTSILTSKRALKAKGHDVLVFAPYDEKSPKEDDTVYCKARKFSMYPGYRMASFLPRELDRLKDFDPDVIHAHGIAGMCIKSLWLSKDLDIPAVLTFHTMVTDAVDLYSPLELNPEFLKRVVKIYLRTAIQRYDIVIIPAASIRSEIEEIAPNLKNVEIVPTGVDTGRFRPDLDCRGILDRWNLHGNKIILSVGRVAEEKNLDVIIEALPVVKKEFPEVKLLVVGEGPAIPKYKALVKSKGIDNDVVFTGFVPKEELPQYYGCCHLFATASTFETQGLVILEAMASGKIVVGARYRAIPEYVIDGETGFLFEPDDVESCASAISKGLRSPDTVGKRARQFAEECSVDSSTEKLIEVYQKAVNGSKK
jgi:1,2-diacylglycerol 3-alpha-glucosyltransferase